MNAGQLILALSPLPSGNAGQHLLAIQLGTGSGPGQTIYCSQAVVLMDYPSTALVSSKEGAGAEIQAKVSGVSVDAGRATATTSPFTALATVQQSCMTLQRRTSRSLGGIPAADKTIIARKGA